MHLVAAGCQLRVTGDTKPGPGLVVGDEWRETNFERGSYGGSEQPGLEATLDGDSMSLRVVPVRYEADGGEERFSSLVDDFDVQWRDPTTYVPDVPRQIAFGVLAEYEPVGGSQRAVYTITDDADDALAAAVWLANGSDDASALHRNIRLHRGDPVSHSQVTVSDDDALTALFAEEPARCIYTGNPTRSHAITLPYRYAPLLDGYRNTDRGLPRVPSTIAFLEGAVSHNAWRDHDLADLDWSTDIQRGDAGEYRLADAIVDAVAGTRADAFCLHRLGDS